MTESVQKKAFREFAHEAEQELGSSLKKLFLYGSVAREEEQEDSDVDVFAVVENKDDLENLRGIAFDIGVLRHGVSISVQGKSEEEFKDFSQTSYLRNVRKEGIEYARS